MNADRPTLDFLTCDSKHTYIFFWPYVYITGCVKCHMYFSTFVFANESWFFLCRVLSFIFYWFGMVRRKLTIPERWQAVGHRRVADHFRVNHSIIVRLMQRFRQMGNVTDRPCAGRPRKTMPSENRLISRRARQRPFSTVGALLAFGGHISTHTVIRQPIKLPVDITSSPCSIWLVTWSFGLDYSDMETGPLVWWKSFFVMPYRRSCKSLAPTKHFISGQPHFVHSCFWGVGV